MNNLTEYKTIYVQESDERLRQMNQDLLLLEREPHNTEALNSIFRSAHTLKSMAASMGYRQISELADRMEDLLARLRSGASPVRQEVVDILFEALDSLESMTLLVRDDSEIERDIAPLIAALNSFVVSDPVTGKENVEDGLSLTPVDRKTMLRAISEGFSCFNVVVELDNECVLKGARAFVILRNLSEMGGVIKSCPDYQLLENEQFDLTFSCIFITKEPKEAVQNRVLNLMDVSGVTIEEVNIPEQSEENTPGDDVSGFPRPDANKSISFVPEGLREIQSARVDIKRLDKLMNLVEELAIGKLRLAAIGQKVPGTELRTVIDDLSRLAGELQTEVMQARLQPVSQIFGRFSRLVRDLAKKENKIVRLETVGGDIELDRTVLDEIGDPLIHILRNAIDHGIETPQERNAAGKPGEGRITLLARREKNHVFIEVEDDGRGMDVRNIGKVALNRGVTTSEALEVMTDMEILLLTTNPGFSTREETTDVSGRGVGLDVARQKARLLGGSIFIQAEAGRGTKISMRLPITTAVIQALLVNARSRTFALPVSNIIEIVDFKSAALKTIRGKEVLMHRDSVLPIARLDMLIQPPAVPCPAPVEERTERTGRDNPRVVILEAGSTMSGIVVDEVIGQHEIVIKQLSKTLRGTRGVAGATILGDGTVALVLDVETFVRDRE